MTFTKPSAALDLCEESILDVTVRGFLLHCLSLPPRSLFLSLHGLSLHITKRKTITAFDLWKWNRDRVLCNFCQGTHTVCVCGFQSVRVKSSHTFSSVYTAVCVCVARALAPLFNTLTHSASCSKMGSDDVLITGFSLKLRGLSPLLFQTGISQEFGDFFSPP